MTAGSGHARRPGRASGAVYGASWEGFVVEQVLAATAGWRASYFRTATGDELDLVLQKRGRRVGIECKASSAPSVTAGFWRAVELLSLREAYVAAPVKSAFPMGKGVDAVPVGELLERLG